ncbi:MAG: hypothetical protein ACQESP_07140 [Candidatus Muiribacteriota bacterium]
MKNNDLYNKNEILQETEIKERLLRFWVKEYKLEDFVISKKTGNLYFKEIIFYIESIKFLKDAEIFSAEGLKKIIGEFKKGKTKINEMKFINEVSDKFLHQFNKRNNIKEKVKTNPPELTGDDYYFNLLKKSEILIKEKNYFDAVNMLTLIKNNSKTYNAIANEMITFIKNNSD